MIIHLPASDLFTVEPAKRFAKEYGVPETVWIQIWLKHKVYDFEFHELHDYALFKCGKPISKKSLNRWIKRTEVYSRAIESGAVTVVSSFFGDLEDFVLKELLKQMRFSGSKNSRSII
jgi:hypothetical protein